MVKKIIKLKLDENIIECLDELRKEYTKDFYKKKMVSYSFVVKEMTINHNYCKKPHQCLACGDDIDGPNITCNQYCYTLYKKQLAHEGKLTQQQPIYWENNKEIFERSNEKNKNDKVGIYSEESIRKARQNTGINSKGQQRLFKRISCIASDDHEIIMEYRDESWSRGYSIDIAIPELKLGFEYNGYYTHRELKGIEHDRSKDEFLNNLGWRMIWLDITTIYHKELAKFFKYFIYEMTDDEYNNSRSIDGYYLLSV